MKSIKKIAAKMGPKSIMRHIAGYVLGFSVFAILIPFGWFRAAHFFNAYPGTGLISNRAIRLVIAGPLLLLGLFFALWSNVALFRFGQGGPTDAFNVAVSPRTRKLVGTGPYRHARNPMVFGMLCVYLAIVIDLNSLPCLALFAAFVLTIIVYLKLTEEKRLLRDFGDSFIAYKKHVPMILPNIFRITKKLVRSGSNLRF